MSNEDRNNPGTDGTTNDERLARLEAMVAQLADENIALRRQLRGDATPTATPTASTAAPTVADESISRRKAFTRIGGAALGVATVYGVTQASPAAATVTAMQLGTDTNEPDAKTIVRAKAGFEGDVLTVYSNTNGDAITGIAGVGPAAAGVWGQADSGWGVYGISTTGYALYSAGRVGFSAFTPTGPPTTGTYALRDIVGDATGNLYCCIEAGAPGKWRLLNPAAAPSFRPVAPFRAYDSRSTAPTPGILAVGTSRVVSVADARSATTGVVVTANQVPAGATAITYNLTVTGTVASGFLAVTAGDATSYTASTINWATANDTIANGGVVPISTNREIKVWQGGGGGTQFIVDVTGYYL